MRRGFRNGFAITTKNPRPLYNALRATGACKSGTDKFLGLSFDQAWDALTWDDVRWLVNKLPSSKAPRSIGAFWALQNVFIPRIAIDTFESSSRYLTDGERVRAFKTNVNRIELKKALNAK